MSTELTHAANTSLPTDGTTQSTDVDTILREITRGGLSGLIVGIVIAGIGGRLVMRLAAVLVPGSTGAITENGNVIGAVTIGGSLALIVFVGLLFGAVAGSLWVVIGPWLPAAALPRAIASVPLAIALGTNALVDDRNRDFAILGHHPPVVASLVVLVALAGPCLVLAERWLDPRLPRPRSGGGVTTAYLLVTALGTLLTLFLVAPLFLGSDLALTGVGIVVVGLVTLATWGIRIRGGRLGPGLILVARTALVIATAIGLWMSALEVAGALDLA